MTPFIILLEEDLAAMMRSWTVWMWLAISGVGGLAGVVFAATFDQESTSFILGWFLLLYVALGSFMVMIISSASGGIDPRTFRGLPWHRRLFMQGRLFFRLFRVSGG